MKRGPESFSNNENVDQTPEEIRPPNWVPEEEQEVNDIRAANRKDLKKGLGITAAVVLGMATLGGMLHEGKEEAKARKARIEQLEKMLAEEPNFPTVISMKPNDPRIKEQERIMRRHAEIVVELEDLKKNTPEN